MIDTWDKGRITVGVRVGCPVGAVPRAALP
jgi:hypothetical protein